MSTYLFSLKYFKVVRELVPIGERTRGRFDVIVWLSYLAAASLMTTWIFSEIYGF
jgi:hypothetical protein